jgi:hypothetical protein
MRYLKLIEEISGWMFSGENLTELLILNSAITFDVAA